MCQHYDFTESDLNPQFLYACVINRGEEETNYHSHDYIELVVIMGGKGHIIINEDRIPVEEGMILIVNPGIMHRSIPEYNMKECYLAFTDVEYSGCGKNRMPLFKGRNIVEKMPEKMKKQVFQICREIEEESRTPHLGRYLMLKACLIQILCLIARGEEETSSEIQSKRYVFRTLGKEYVVGQIQKYFEEHYKEHISLNQIASNMYLSTFYISKIFKSETGDTPINYLIGLRMEKAREILERDPSVSVQKVADEVGYDDAYHFSKLFKKYYGISPVYYKARKTLEREENHVER